MRNSLGKILRVSEVGKFFHVLSTKHLCFHVFDRWPTPK